MSAAATAAVAINAYLIFLDLGLPKYNISILEIIYRSSLDVSTSMKIRMEVLHSLKVFVSTYL